MARRVRARRARPRPRPESRSSSRAKPRYVPPSPPLRARQTRARGPRARSSRRRRAHPDDPPSASCQRGRLRLVPCRASARAGPGRLQFRAPRARRQGAVLARCAPRGTTRCAAGSREQSATSRPSRRALPRARPARCHRGRGVTAAHRCPTLRRARATRRSPPRSADPPRRRGSRRRAEASSLGHSGEPRRPR